MYQRRRAESSMASLVVTNYHMLFIEKRLPAPSLFPCEIIVMDEGHEVPDIYRSTTDKRITQKGIEHAIQETFNIAISYPTVNEIVRSKINNSNILSNVKEFFNQVAMTYYSSGEDRCGICRIYVRRFLY
jgi:Rad3-related DNA helicase